ncbi:hypothetical protein [Piscirickettsia litoralis]|uniref:Uncharacterized protein n=1 Tax=Piscirickettsia litoralis TaxID=1891921 RepID=A0ABX3A5X2_9GAMM|nr:hypothetical protein [Piscirickettsia litoralis]ODN41504.1 hypothetical protein BGC07_15460 [Piscirickettsia litoralis]
MNVKQDFLNYVKNHSLEVVIDDGVHRHLRFTNDGSLTHHFTITTSPQHLCVGGDFGTYVFRSHEDMFDFFRGGVDINPHYWSEKLVSNSVFVGYKKFSVEEFEKSVTEYFNGHEFDSEDEKQEVWEEIERQIFRCDDEHSASCAIREFESSYDFNFYSFYGNFLTIYETIFNLFACNFIHYFKV